MTMTASSSSPSMITSSSTNTTLRRRKLVVPRRTSRSKRQRTRAAFWSQGRYRQQKHSPMLTLLLMLLLVVLLVLPTVVIFDGKIGKRSDGCFTGVDAVPIESVSSQQQQQQAAMTGRQQQPPPPSPPSASNVIHVRYGYFAEPRPSHVACARRWFDLYVPTTDTYYQVSCHPQSSGRYAAARLDYNYNSEEERESSNNSNNNNGPAPSLHLAHLGSTPLVEALVRKVPIQLIYMTQYAGDSQGIYVRAEGDTRSSSSSSNSTGGRHISTPLDLIGRTLGVPFGSTMHFQVLFLLDLLGLTGQVDLLNLSPAQIMTAWDNGSIDAAGVWGTARDHLLQLDVDRDGTNGDIRKLEEVQDLEDGQEQYPPADTLLTSKVLADWGRPTFTALAVNTEFGQQHPEFVAHVVSVVSRLHDSYLDRFGAISPNNVERWDATGDDMYNISDVVTEPTLSPSLTTTANTDPSSPSLVGSMVDALMISGEVAGTPSMFQRNMQRRALEAFVQLSANEQLGCNYFGGSIVSQSSDICPPTSSSRLFTELQQTADFLLDQKLVASAVIDSETAINGTYLSLAYRRCDACHPVGRYAELGELGYTGGAGFNLLDRFETLDSEQQGQVDPSTKPYATPYEIGRSSTRGETKAGDSTCSTLWGNIGDEFVDVRETGSFGDGSNAQPGLTYSDNLRCNLTVHGADLVWLEMDRLRLWSGDFVRFYTDPLDSTCSNIDSPSRVLLAQYSGLYEGSPNLPAVVAQYCVMVQLTTDGNSERSYNDRSETSGDGILISFDRSYEGCTSDNDCGDSPDNTCDFETRLCRCGIVDMLPRRSDQLRPNCNFLDACVGTKVVEYQPYSSPPNIVITDGQDEHYSDSAVETYGGYQNGIDCAWEFRIPHFTLPGEQHMLDIELEWYNLEDTFDFLYFNTGPVASQADSKATYAVITGDGSLSAANPRKITLPVDGDGIAHIRFKSDSMGRRAGFRARMVDFYGTESNNEEVCSEPGQFGVDCESSHCSRSNPFQVAAQQDVSEQNNIGRLTTQQKGVEIPPLSKCRWDLDEAYGGKPWYDHAKSFRLVFHQPFDLEAHPAGSAGDKLIVSTGDDSSVLFVEECKDDDDCTYGWQTGTCDNATSTCDVATTVEVPISQGSKTADFTVMTDRNDGDNVHKGLDLDIFLVSTCPIDGHCESESGNRCEDGFCICSGGVPCDCSCEGKPPVVLKSTKLAVGIIVPIIVIFILVFFFYRRRKIRQARDRKKIIAAQEAELDAFRNSVVGMQVAQTQYIPFTSDERISFMRSSGVLSIKNLGSSLTSSLPDNRDDNSNETAIWCWQETEMMMNHHSDDEIVGDPTECFIKYDAKSNDLLEQAYKTQKGRGTCVPRDGYVVDFNTLIQTKTSTGFQREVKRVVDGNALDLTFNKALLDQDNTQKSTTSDSDSTVDLKQCVYGERLPADLKGEPQMVLVKGDIVQISKQRNDGWAFGTKLHHANDVAARELAKAATSSLTDADDGNVFTDTGWFQLKATEIPTGEELKILQTKVGDTDVLEPPKEWEDVTDPTVVERFKIPKKSAEYKNIADAFMSTLQPPSFHKKAKIVSVERVQNLAMWQSYVVKRQTICYRETGLKSSDDSANAAAVQKRALARFERSYLWHGTNAEVMDKILQQGFNRSFCGKNATMYGKGVYFARDASYSAYPTYSVPDDNGYQYMLACRVVVGEYCRGKKDALTPDVRDPVTQSLYDTTVGLLGKDNLSNPSIYVTYHDAQAYPCYIVKFRLK